MSELKKIKEKAFEFVMNLHPKQIKVLNNEILRPLYRMAEQAQSTEETRILKGLVSSLDQDTKDLKSALDQAEHEAKLKGEIIQDLKKREMELIQKLKQTETESIEIIEAYKVKAEKAEEDFVTATNLLIAKQKIIDQFMKGKVKN